jgi:hypothetical protein
VAEPIADDTQSQLERFKKQVLYLAGLKFEAAKVLVYNKIRADRIAEERRVFWAQNKAFCREQLKEQAVIQKHAIAKAARLQAGVHRAARLKDIQ